MDTATRIRLLLVFGAAMGLGAVALGAFGAHSLESRLAPNLARAWEKAVDYQAMHALASLVAGLLASVSRRQTAIWAGAFFLAGILLFSGSLYLLALGGPRWLGPVTPLGGMFFLVGWATLGLAAWRIPRTGTLD